MAKRATRGRGAEAEHAGSEQREAVGLFLALIDSLPDGILIADKYGRIVLANSQAQALFGYGPDEFLGKPVEILVPERMRKTYAQHRAEYERGPRGRTRPRFGTVGLRRDGSEFDAEISAVLGLSEVNVRVSIFRALKRLRSLIEEDTL